MEVERKWVDLCHTFSIGDSIQLKSSVTFCPSPYNLLPLDTHRIHNILLCTTDLTDSYTAALTTVCIYRVLLLLIVFMLL